MDLLRLSIRQPVTVIVGVILVLLAGVLALRRIPIQLTPNVEDTIIAVTTRWEGASPREIEQNVVDPQEERLQGITGLERMTSTSQQGVGAIRLEFAVGTPKDIALREVSDKLREVPSYPDNVDEPIVDASDPENRDYIAWFVLDGSDPAFDVRKHQDFGQDRIKPILERIPGVARINVLGGREREAHVRFDPDRLAQVGIPIHAFAAALRLTNENFSAGALNESQAEVRIRMVSQFESVEQVLDTLIAQTASGAVYVRDVAEVVETFKEPTSFVRSRGRPVIAINAQREVGANVMEVMAGLRAAVADLNAPKGLLASYARQLGLDGTLSIEQVYDQTTYIDDALALVRSNIWIGGGLALLVLLLFLRSVRSPAIVALSIPISIVGAIVFLVALGRSVNVVSLAGMAFAVGMVVDNAIVVLENIFRHIEMGKAPARAAYDGSREVFGAVVAATLTTVVVFMPILLIQEEAGQLFRDIALAIVASVSLSLVVSVTVIPCASARILQPTAARTGRGGLLRRTPDAIAGLVHFFTKSAALSIAIVALLTAASLIGTWMLLPPADYLPVGNRNLVFGLIVPPPGMSTDQQETLGLRVEEKMRPYFEAGQYALGTPEYEAAVAALEPVPTFDFARMAPGEPIVPPPLENYFLVGFPGTMFHGGVGANPERVADLQPLFQHATRAEVLPGVMAFAFQVPLFRLGGRSGSAVEINFSGDDLERVAAAARSVYLKMLPLYGPFSLQPDPSNFDLPTPELQLIPDRARLGEVGLTPAELGIAVQALGDGAFLGDYVVGSQTIDLKIIARDSLADAPLAHLADQPIATPLGGVVPLSSLAQLRRVNAPGQINRTDRRRSVSLQFTPPPGMPLGEAMASVSGLLAAGRDDSSIPLDVETNYSGSASKLDAVTTAMLGDGTLAGTLGSSLILAVLVVYLLMCILFQSFLRPLIILISVPLATLGGFAALAGVHAWSQADRHMPVQNLDVLTMLGFIILIGIVVNNAILIVHQASQFMRGTGDEGPLGQPLAPREAIVEAVRSRVRPIFMGMLTSVLGMSPLIFMPGAGSELYRGLGSVVVGGLLVSTLFTLFLVPLLLSLASQLQDRLGLLPERRRGKSLDPTGQGRAAAGTALIVLIALLPTLGGCSSAPPHRSSITRAEDMLRSELARLQSDSSHPRARNVADDAQAADILKDQHDELEALGGPASWDIPVDLGANLQGAATDTQPLTLTDAVDTALATNLGLEIIRLQADADREGIEVQDAAFDPVLFSALEGETARNPNRVPVIGGIAIGVPRSAQDRLLGELGVRQLLRSGATVSVSAFLEAIDDHTPGIAFQPDPAWRSGLAVSLTQPLLRGRGANIAGAPLEFVERGAARSAEDVAADALVLVALTEQAYWDLVEAWSALRIRRHLADQIAEVERVLRARLDFDADRAAYSDALATLRRREADVVRARRLVRAASDNLKVLMDAPFAPLESEVVLDPVDTLATETPAPHAPELDIPMGVAIAGALERRPEVRRALLEIEDAELRERLAADARRPRLDLFVGVSLAGLEDEPGGSFSSLAEDEEWTAIVGLALDHPLGARAGRAGERQARLLAEQALREYQRVLRDVVREVKESLRDLRTNIELVDAARSTRLAETENLRAILIEEESRSRLTPEFLALKLSRRDRLAAAQLTEVEAMANTRRALAAYRRALGIGPPEASPGE